MGFVELGTTVSASASQKNAPARTPNDIIERMNREMVAVLNDPEVRSKLAVAYIEPIGSSPAELTKWMVEERTRWAPVIKHAALKAE